MTRDEARQRLAEAMRALGDFSTMTDAEIAAVLAAGDLDDARADAVFHWLDAILADPDTIERVATAIRDADWPECEPVTKDDRSLAVLVLAAIIPKGQP